MGISLVVGLGFMIHGAWLVLPFSILEMLFLGACIYLCLLKVRQTGSYHDFRT